MENDIGRNVSRLREERGWDKADLARKAHVSESWLSRLERGEHNRPSAAMLGKVANALNVDLQMLTRGPKPAMTDEELAELQELRQNPELRVQFASIARSYEEMSDEGKRGLLETLRFIARAQGIPTGE